MMILGMEFSRITAVMADDSCCDASRQESVQTLPMSQGFFYVRKCEG